MAKFKCYLGGKAQSFNFASLASTIEKVASRPARSGAVRSMAARSSAGAAKPRNRGVAKMLKAQSCRLETRFHSIGNDDEIMTSPAGGNTLLIATESMIVNEPKAADIRWLRDQYGMEIAQEGRFSVLLRSPTGGMDGIKAAFSASHAIVKSGRVDCSHPNFIRMAPRPRSGTGSVYKSNWGLDNHGSPGVIGADVHALAAWTITKGESNIRIAVLDEGVDTKHSWLKDVVVDEADFVDDNDHSIPDADDAHGTACAGIISSQHKVVKGLAHGCSLVGVRIAKSDASGEDWIIDDFDTGDAIDWSWKEAKSDVLSNSWSGGVPTDAVTLAIERARTKGRNGKGSVVIFAAGNDQSPITYPSTLDGVLTVGASNQWDARKTTSSDDGEDWWGSNYGASLDLVAPGVSIATTDIRGAKGYSPTLYTPDFNGTSSATPHVAATAGLILSIRPDLRETDVREIIKRSADFIDGQNKRTNQLGHGRLNAYQALRLARRW